MRAFVFSALLALSTLACQQKSEPAPASEPAPGASAAASGAAAPAASAAAGGEAKADSKAQTGAFTGAYKAVATQLYLPDTPEMQKRWRTDEDSAGVGDGELTLTIAEDGRVSGESKGALGVLQLNGKAEGDQVTAKIEPTEANGFSGTLHATRKDGALEGDMHLSSYNANVLRKGTFTLTAK